MRNVERPTSVSVEFCDCQGFVSQMVGKEVIDIAGSEVFISDHSEVLGIALGWFDSCQLDNLIADYASFWITSSGLNNFVQHVVFSPGYEECSVLVDMVKESEKIDITFIQKIDGSHLNTESVKSLDIMHRGICKVDKRVCIFIPALVVLNFAHGQSFKQRLMVLLSKA